MAERHRLVRTLALPGDPRRALQLIERHARDYHNQARQHETRADQRVRTAVKYLRHACVPAASGQRVRCRLLVLRLLVILCCSRVACRVRCVKNPVLTL